MTKIPRSRFNTQFIKNRSSELEQALVRFIFGLLFAVYIYYIHYSGWLGGIAIEAIYLVNLYLVFAAGLIISSSYYGAGNKIQRITSILVDIVLITFALIIGGLVTAACYGGYLWVTIANGLRFGRNYLYLATVMSIVSFSIVIMLSDFWQQRYIFGLGLMLWLILLPLYILKLLLKLEEAVNNANSANEAKSRFLANMSHEIRTPLTGIIGFSEILRDGQLKITERVECVSQISKSGSHLLQIINDILDISKIEENKIDLECLEFNIFDLIIDIKAIIKPQILDKGITLSTQYEFPFPKVILGDPLRIKQILINLCSNAAKFTNDGEILIRLSFNDHNKLIQIEVSDTGIGMTKEQCVKVFDAFQQADTATTRKYGGTGLGLSLSKQLAEKMHGDIEVTSSINIGSTFVFSFPYISASNEIFAHSYDDAEKTDNVDVLITECVTGKVLLAEDNAINQKLLKILINETGADIDIVEDGKNAMEKALSESYDLILMDMQMPVIGGLEATQTLRGYGYRGAIVALTANATIDDNIKCREAGCDGFLTKPIDRNQLYQTITKYLNVVTQLESEDAIYSQIGNSNDRLKSLSLEFAEGLPDFIEKSVRLLREHKLDEFKSEMHQLKGLGGAVGYPQMAEAAGQLEFALAKNSMDETGRILDSMINMSRRIAKGVTPSTTA